MSDFIKHKTGCPGIENELLHTGTFFPLFNSKS